MSDITWLAIVLVASAGGCVVSAAAGMGGSLIIVPALVALVGPTKGVALAALILGVNNIGKVIAYRRSLPFRTALPVAVVVAIGAALGARLLLALSDTVVSIAVVVVLVSSFASERFEVGRVGRISAPVLGFFSGAASGFSGTSGPLKGAALRNLQLDRHHLVGAASIVSMFGDLSKSLVFAQASVLGTREVTAAAAAIPVMFLSVRAGRRLNQQVGEQGYAVLFWTVMFGYGVRVLLV